MKIFVNAPNESWIIDRMADEWKINNKNIYTSNPYKADVIWLLADFCWNQLDINLLKSKKVITSIHHIVPEKFNDIARKEFYLRDNVTDLYHCFNDRTIELVQSITNKSLRKVPYWINLDYWSPETKFDIRRNIRNKYKIPQTTFLIGSFQRDTEGHDLKSPKLEKGPDIFCDYVISLATQHPNLHVLLGGWRRQYVINRLQAAKVAFTYVERPHLDEIKSMYQALDLYVVSSRYEGGPQAILEAAALNIPIISTPVGIAEQILAPESINQNLYDAKSNTVIANINIQNHKFDNVFPQYISMFQDVL